MQIIYNDVDVTSSVHPLTLKLTDNAGGKADSITSVFSDTEGLWSKWKPAKNDRIRVKHEGYDSGVMYIDHIGQRAGKFEIKALSIPQTAKTARSQGWENVRLLEIASEIAARYDFRLQTYNVTNFLYDRVDQMEVADFAFLADRCMLEGCALKINDGTVVIYDESKEEQKVPDARSTIYQNDMRGEYEFADKSIDIYGKCIVRSQTRNGYVEGEFTDPAVSGPTLPKNLYAADIGEATRWARGILRFHNKHRVVGKINVDLRPGIAAGSVVTIKEVGLFDGRYFVHHLVHDLLNNQTKLVLRRPLEGY